MSDYSSVETKGDVERELIGAALQNGEGETVDAAFGSCENARF